MKTTVRRSWLGSAFQQWWLFAAILVVWQLVAAAVGNRLVPTPSVIVATAVHEWFSGPPSHVWLTDSAVANLLPSLGRFVVGWLLAAVAGIVLGLLLGRSRTARAYLGPVLHWARGLPPTLLFPFWLVVFGLGNTTQVVTIAAGSVWPILLNTIDGAATIDPVRRDTALAFRIGRPQWIIEVVLPTALPKIAAGLRVSMAVALILMVFSELRGASNGIGYQLDYARSSYDIPLLWAGIALLGALGYLANRGLLAVERRVLAWSPAGAT